MDANRSAAELPAVQHNVVLLREGSGGTEVQLECGDEGAISPSDGRAALAYEAPPADTNAVDPWEQRGSQAEER